MERDKYSINSTIAVANGQESISLQYWNEVPL